jgi:hypothetical protein
MDASYGLPMVAAGWSLQWRESKDVIGGARSFPSLFPWPASSWLFPDCLVPFFGQNNHL